VIQNPKTPKPHFFKKRIMDNIQLSKIILDNCFPISSYLAESLN
jgi:hypothetical protein